MSPRIPTEVRRTAVTLGRFRDLRGTLAALEQKRLLEVTELFEIKQALRLFRELSEMESLLRAASVDVIAMPEAEVLLDPGDRKTSGFYLYDEYSPLLEKLRKQRSILERQMDLDDSGRRESMLSERASLVAEEEREEAAVRAGLTDALAEHLETLKANFSAVGVLDFRLARAVLANDWGSGKPSLIDEGAPALLEDMIHPVVAEELRKRGSDICPAIRLTSAGDDHSLGSEHGRQIGRPEIDDVGARLDSTWILSSRRPVRDASLRFHQLQF